MTRMLIIMAAVAVSTLALSASTAEASPRGYRGYRAAPHARYHPRHYRYAPPRARYHYHHRAYRPYRPLPRAAYYRGGGGFYIGRPYGGFGFYW